MERLVLLISQTFEVGVNVILKWKDDEDEMCTVSTDAELSEAINVSKELGKSNLKMYLFEAAIYPSDDVKHRNSESKAPESQQSAKAKSGLSNGDVLALFKSFCMDVGVTQNLPEVLRQGMTALNTITDEKSASAVLEGMICQSSAIRDHAFTQALLPLIRDQLVQRLQRLQQAGPMIQSMLPQVLPMLPQLLQNIPMMLSGVEQRLGPQLSQPFSDFTTTILPQLAPMLMPMLMPLMMFGSGIGTGGPDGSPSMPGFGPGMFANMGMPPSFSQGMHSQGMGPLADLFGGGGGGGLGGQGFNPFAQAFGHQWSQQQGFSNQQQGAQPNPQQAASSRPASVQRSADEIKYAPQLRTLESMGFADTSHNIQLLNLFNGDINQVIDMLFNRFA